MRLANTVAVWGTGICFVIVGFVPDEYPFLAILVFTLHQAVGSANCGGFYKCGTFVSRFFSSQINRPIFLNIYLLRQYAHFVVAGIQFLKSLTMFFSPILVATFVLDESDRAQWRQIFLGMAIVLFFVSSNFCLVFVRS
jgi:hypothetical protein